MNGCSSNYVSIRWDVVTVLVLLCALCNSISITKCSNPTPSSVPWSGLAVHRYRCGIWHNTGLYNAVTIFFFVELDQAPGPDPSCTDKCMRIACACVHACMFVHIETLFGTPMNPYSRHMVQKCAKKLSYHFLSEARVTM